MLTLHQYLQTCVPTRIVQRLGTPYSTNLYHSFFVSNEEHSYGFVASLKSYTSPYISIGLNRTFDLFAPDFKKEFSQYDDFPVSIKDKHLLLSFVSPINSYPSPEQDTIDALQPFLPSNSILVNTPDKPQIFLNQNTTLDVFLGYVHMKTREETMTIPKRDFPFISGFSPPISPSSPLTILSSLQPPKT